MKIIAAVVKYRKPITICFALVVLNIIFGLDLRFTIINLIWLLF